MSRPLRIEYEGAFYHVMNRGNARQNIFTQPKDYETFINVLVESIKLWELKVHALALLPNHYHMLIETPLANLSRAMRHINGVYTQRFNRQHQRDGHIFRGRYKAILVEEDAYLVELIRYIHRNPIKAGLVEFPEKYKWSSHRDYLGSDDRKWLTTNYILSYFGKRKNRSRLRLHEFVMNEVPEGLEKRLDGFSWPSVLSSDNFEEWIKWNFVKDIDKEKLEYRDCNIKKVSAKKLKKVLCEAFDTSWNALTQANSLVGRQNRAMAIYYYRQYLKLTYDELSKIFNLKPARISRIMSAEVKTKPEASEYIHASMQE
ncbi:MAG: transposase [Pseudomonadota bacterium]